MVAGHVAALMLAHDRALALYDDPKLAVRSQYWMLAVMVGFTSLALATVVGELMTFLIAHAGHWLTTIAYFVPVVAFLVWLGITQIRRGAGAADTSNKRSPGLTQAVEMQDRPVVGWGDDPYGRRMTRIPLIFLLAVGLLAGCDSDNSDRAGGQKPAKPKVLVMATSTASSASSRRSTRPSSACQAAT